MNSRAWVFETLTASADVTALVPQSNIFSSSGLTAVGNVPATKPFIIYKFNSTDRPFPGAQTEEMQVWVYDDPGSYVRIDTILRRVIGTLDTPIVLPDGVCSRWIGNSGDLIDDILGITKYASFIINGRTES